MMRFRHGALWSAAILLVAGRTGLGADLQVGKPFPELTLPALEDGRAGSLRDFRGRKLVLHVWASW